MTRNQALTLFATTVGSGIVILDSTVVNLALPKMGANLHASFADLQWIADGYLLSLSSLILLGGSLGDIFGRKKAYMIGLLGFGITSLLSGLAPTAAALIGLRLLQGVFGALLVPGGLAIINTNFSRQERGAAIGVWSAWSSVFAALGPLVGGYLLDVANWRWIFYINVPLVAICYLTGFRSINEGKDDVARTVDVRGALVAMLSLAGLTYGLIEGPAHHWSPITIVQLVAGLLLATGFIYLEKHTADPLVKLDLFKSGNFSGSNLMTFGMYGALGGFMFALVIHLQTALHYSSIAAGASMLPVTILMILFSRRTGALAARYGARLFLTVGPLISAVGIISLWRLRADSSYLTVVLPGVLLFGVGLVTIVAPLTTTVMTSVPDSSSGIASAINNAVSRVAGLLVVALLGLLGTAHVFHFAVVICAILAALAGIVSWLTIDDEPLHRSSAGAKS